MVLIPYGTRHTARFEADVWKPVRCERCGCEFAYRIQVSTKGESTNHLWLTRDRAVASARSQAIDAAMQKIQGAKQSYACPSCGIYQSDMVKSLKSENIGRIRASSVLLGFGLFVISAVLIQEAFSASLGESKTTAAFMIAVIACSGVGLWFRFRERPQYDPNAQFQKRAGQSFSKAYPVLRRPDLDALLARNRLHGVRPELVLPWPPQ